MPFRKLNPRTMARTRSCSWSRSAACSRPGGSIQRRVQGRPGSASSSRSPSGCGSRCCSRTSPRRWPKAAARRRPIRCARRAPRRSPTSCVGGRPRREGAGGEPPQGRPGARRRRRVHPRRRRDHRRRRVGRRVGDHRRVGAGHPRVGRRSLGGHRRHAGALGLDQGPHHLRSGRDVPRPDDRAGRRRRAAEDAERDRAQHPARRADDHLPARGGHAAAVRDLLRRAAVRCSCSSRCWSA